jgi:ubiquinone/menaquinone biosynthesis C-methylase UbiE
MSDRIDEISVRKQVKEMYSGLAKKEIKSTPGSGSDRGYVETIGYSGDKLALLPDNVVGVSAGCGNPTAIAGLKKGQAVLDLGSGGGIDVFIAAQEVGAEGKVIGIDCTPEMIWRARESAKKIGVSNVEFRLGEIECMPVEGNSIDVAISNCVINLSPDKDKVFREVFRVLKPGGKLCISDMVTTETVNADEMEKLRSWASCIGGAIPLKEYLEKIKNTGFINVKVESQHTYTIEELSFMMEGSGCGCGCCEPVSQLKSYTGNKMLSKVATVKIVAYKPDIK